MEEMSMQFFTCCVLDLIIHECQSKYSASFLDFILGLPIGSNSKILDLSYFRYIDMAELLCQKRALEAFRLDPAKWGGKPTRQTYQ